MTEVRGAVARTEDQHPGAGRSGRCRMVGIGDDVGHLAQLHGRGEVVVRG